MQQTICNSWEKENFTRRQSNAVQRYAGQVLQRTLHCELIVM